MLKGRWLAIPLFCCLGAASSLADDIRPEARALADARPMADEKCIEKCDLDSDKCMQDAGGRSRQGPGLRRQVQRMPAGSARAAEIA